MNSGKIIGLLFFILITHSLIAQKDSNLKWINNDNIKYHVVFAADYNEKDILPLSISRYLILAEISATCYDSLRKFQWSEWQTLLNSAKSDWAANLLLYYIYKKDAIVFNCVIKSRNDWIGQNKTNDVKEWEEFFKKKRNKKYKD